MGKIVGDWRRESDKEVAQLSEQCACNTTHWMCECQQERMVKLERLVEDALGYVEYAAENHINDYWSLKGLSWLARYREMFTPEVK